MKNHIEMKKRIKTMLNFVEIACLIGLRKKTNSSYREGTKARFSLSLFLFFGFLLGGMGQSYANITISLPAGKKIEIKVEKKVLSKAEAEYNIANDVDIPLKVYAVFPTEWETYFKDANGMKFTFGNIDYKITKGSAKIKATLAGGITCNGGAKTDAMAITWLADQNSTVCPTISYAFGTNGSLPFGGMTVGGVTVSPTVGNVVELGTVYFRLANTKDFEVTFGKFNSNYAGGEAARDIMVFNLMAANNSNPYTNSATGRTDWAYGTGASDNFIFTAGGISILGAPEIVLSREALIPACPDGELNATAVITPIDTKVVAAKIKWQYAPAGTDALTGTWLDVPLDANISVSNPPEIALGASTNNTSTLKIAKTAYATWNTRLLRCVATDENGNIGYMNPTGIVVHNLERFVIGLDTTTNNRALLTTTDTENTLGHQVSVFTLPALGIISYQPVKVGTTNVASGVYPFATGTSFENVKRIQGSTTEEVTPSKFLNQKLTVTGRPTYYYIRAYVTSQNCLASSDTILVKADFEALAPTITNAIKCFGDAANKPTITANSNLIGAIPTKWEWIVRAEATPITTDPETTPLGASGIATASFYGVKLVDDDPSGTTINPRLSASQSTISTVRFSGATIGASLLPENDLMLGASYPTANGDKRKWLLMSVYARYTYNDPLTNQEKKSDWGSFKVVTPTSSVLSGLSADTLKFKSQDKSIREITVNAGEAVSIERVNSLIQPTAGIVQEFTWEKEDPLNSDIWYFEKRNAPPIISKESSNVKLDLAAVSNSAKYRVRYDIDACTDVSEPIQINVRKSVSAGYITATYAAAAFSSGDKACAGQNVAFTLNNYVSGAGSSVKWYYKIGANTTEYPIADFAVDASTKSTPFSAGLTPESCVFNVFAVVKSADGIESTTEAFEVKVLTNAVSPTFVISPSTNVCVGAEVNMTATFTPATNTAAPAVYQWQSSTDGTTWTPAAQQNNGTAYKFIMSATSALQYRAAAINAPCPVSAAAKQTLVRNPLPTLGSIAAVPVLPTKGGAATLTYTDSYSSGYTYAWTKQQIAPSKDGIIFADASFISPKDATNASGANIANKYTVTNENTKSMGLSTFQDTTVKYRMSVTNSATTCANTLEANYEPAAALLPGLSINKTSVCPGVADVSLTLANVSLGTLITWEYSTNGGSTYKTMQATSTSSFTVPASVLVNTGTVDITYTFRASALGLLTLPTVSLTVKAATKAGISFSNPTPSFCENADTALTVSTTQNANFAWESSTNGTTWTTVSGASGNGTKSSTLSITNYAGSIKQYRAIATVTSQTGANCYAPDTAKAIITMVSQPAKATISGNAAVCANSPISLTASATGTTYVWTGATPAITATTKTVSFTPTTAATQNITVKYQANGCWSAQSDAFTLNVNKLPTLGAITITGTPDKANMCNLIKREFSVTSTNATGTVNYDWTITAGTGTLECQTTPLCQTSGSGTIKADYTPNASGAHELKVVATDANTCVSAPKEISLGVMGSSTVSFTTNLDDATICQGTDKTFTATVNLLSAFQWEVHNGATWSNIAATTGATNATTSTLTLSNVQNTNYKYRVTATPSGGGCAAPSTSNIATLTMTATPATAAVSAITAVCAASPATLSTTTTGKTAYEWKGGTAGTTAITGTTASINYTPTTAGTEKISVRYQENGCWSAWSATQNLTVNARPTTGAITLTPAAICSGLKTVLALTPTGGTSPYTITWQKDGVNISTGLSGNDYTPALNTGTTARTETIGASVADANGCTPASTPATKTLTVNPAVTIAVAAATGTAEVCEATASTTLSPNPSSTISGATFSNFIWSKNGIAITSGADGYTVNASTGILTIADAKTTHTGNYTYTAQATANSCTSAVSAASAAKAFSVNALPTAGTISADPVCARGVATLTSSGASSAATPINYTFKLNNTLIGTANQSSNKVSSSATSVVGTAIPISVTITDAKGCTSTVTSTFEVYPNPTASAIAITNAITNATPTTLYKDVAYKFTTTPSGGSGSGYTYAWIHNPEGSNLGTTQEVSYTPTAIVSQSVNVTVTDSRGCSTPTYSSTFTPANSTPVSFSTNLAATASWCEGITKTHSVTVQGAITCNYEWASSADGTAWTIVTGHTGQGTASSSLTVTNPTAGNLKYRVRAIPTVDGSSEAMSTICEVSTHAIPAQAVISGKIGTTAANAVCQSTAITLETGITDADANSFTWTATNPTISAKTASLNYTPANAGTQNIKVKYLRNGCESPLSADFALTVHPKITAVTATTFSPASPVCPGVEVDVTAGTFTGGTSPSTGTFVWKLNGNPISGAISNTFKHTASANATAANINDAFTFEVTDTKGCAFTAAVTNLVVKPTPTLGGAITPSVALATVCENTPLTLTAAGTNGDAYTYEWTKTRPGATVIGTNAALSLTGALSEAGTYIVKISGSKSSCQGTPYTVHQLVTINALPIPGTIAATTVCEGTNSSFSLSDASGTGTLKYTYYIDNAQRGAALTTNPANIAITNADHGKSIKAVVTDAQGCMATTTNTDATISVNPNPVLAPIKMLNVATNTDVTGVLYIGEQYKLHATFNTGGTSPYTYLWTNTIAVAGVFPETQTGQTSTPEKLYTPAVAGNQTITLKATDANGCVSAPITRLFESTTAADLSFSPDGAAAKSLCLDASNKGTTTISTTVPVAATFVWEYKTNDGAWTSTAPGGHVASGSLSKVATLTITDPAVNAYQYRVKASALGYATTTSQPFGLNVYAQAVAPIITGNAAVCQGVDLNLSTSNITNAADFDANSFVWTASPAISSTGNTAIYKPTTSTTGEQTITASYKKNGCASAVSTAFKVMVNPAITAVAIGFSPVSPVCPGTSLTATPTLSGGSIDATTDYVWNVDGTAMASSTTPEYTYTAANATDADKTIAFLLTVTDKNGCAFTTPTATNLRVKPTPVLNVSATLSNAELCVGGNTLFTASPSSTPSGATGYAYQWMLDGVDINGATGATYAIATATAAHAGKYTVKLSAGNLNSCVPASYPISAEVDFTVNDLPVAGTITAHDAICQNTGTTFTLTDAALGATTKASVLSYQFKESATWTDTKKTYTSPSGISGTYTPTTSGTKTITVVVSDNKGCSAATTPSITMQVDAATVKPNTIKDGGNQATSTLCANATVYPTLTASGMTGNVIRWEKSTTSASAGFTAIDASNSASYTLTAADVTMPAATVAQSKNWYRAVVQNGACDEVASTLTYVLTIDNMPVAGTITRTTPADNPTLLKETLCTNDARSYALGASLGSIQWQYSVDGLLAWTSVSGATSANFTPTIVEGDRYYRASLINGTCTTAATTTNNIELKGVAQPALGLISVKLTSDNAPVTANGVCEGTEIELSLGEQDHSTIQWQSDVTGTLADITGETNFTITQSPSKTTIYQATVKTASCAAQMLRFTVNVTPTPAITSIDPASPYMMCNASANTALSLVGSTGSATTWKVSTSTDFTTANGFAANLNYTTLMPKTQEDTTLYFQATHAPASGVLGCTPVQSTVLKVMVGATPIKPILVKKSSTINHCKSSDLELEVTNAKRGTLHWYIKRPGETEFSFLMKNNPTYTITSDLLEAGTYAFKVLDSIVITDGSVSCGNAISSDILTVVVAAPASLNSVMPDPANGFVCANSTAKIVSSANGAVIYQWQSANSPSDVPANIVGATTADYTTPSMAAGVRYYRVYVNSDVACKADTSKLIKIEAMASPSVVLTSPTANTPVCKGTEVPLTVSYANATRVVWYAGTLTGATTEKYTDEVSLSTSSANKTYNLPTTATANQSVFYLVKVFNDSIKSGACMSATTVEKLQTVNDNSQGGELRSNGNKELSQTAGLALPLALSGVNTNAKYTIEYTTASAGASSMDSYTPLSDANNATYPGTVVNKNPIVPSGDSIWYRVRVTNGACPEVIGDTVKVKIIAANQILLQAKKTTGAANVGQGSALCLNTSVDISVASVPAGAIDRTYKQWEMYKQGSGDDLNPVWTPTLINPEVTTQTVPTGLTYVLASTETGTYRVRLMFYEDANTTAVYSAEFSLSYQAPATQGTMDLTIDGNSGLVQGNLCLNGGISAEMTLSDYENGTVTAWERAKNEGFTAGKVVLPNTASENHTVDGSDMNDSAWFRAVVSSSVCGDVYSNPRLISIHKASTPGTLTAKTTTAISSGNSICFNTSTTFTLAGNVGQVTKWQVSAISDVDGFEDIATTSNKLQYTDVITHQQWFRAMVQNTNICTEVATSAFNVQIYDTVIIKTQPINAVGTETKAAQLVAEAQSSSFEGGSTPISNVKYEWQFAIAPDYTTWTTVPTSGVGNPVPPTNSIDNGVFKSTLSVPFAYFFANGGADISKQYRCVITTITPNCGTDQEITKAVSITKELDSDPGVISTLMGTNPENCYYIDSMATFFMKGYIGADMKFTWSIVKSATVGDTIPLDVTNFPELQISAKGDTVSFRGSAQWLSHNYQIYVVVEDLGASTKPKWYKTFGLCGQTAPAFDIKMQLSSDTICVTQEPLYTVTPEDSDNRSYIYAWAVKKKGDANFVSIPSTSGNYEVGAQTFKIKNTTIALDSAIIKVDIKEVANSVGIVKTFTQVLRVQEPIKDVDILTGDTLCEGSDVQLIASTSNSLTPVTYTWEKYTTGAWGEKQAATIGANVLDFTNLTKTDSTQYRVKASNRCNIAPAALSVTSAAVTLAVKALPQIITQPVIDIPALCNGGSVNIVVETLGDDVGYQWKYEGVDLMASTNILNVNTEKLTLNNLRVNQSGAYQVQLKGNVACQSIIDANSALYLSETAVLRVDTVPLYETLANKTGVVYKQITFDAVVTNDTITPLSYTWYIQRPTDANFVKIEDLITATPAYADTFADYGTKNLIIKDLPLRYNQSKLKCELENPCGVSTTNEAILKVLNKLEIVEQAKDAMVCADMDTTFEIEVNLEPYDIQWQYRQNASSAWVSIAQGNAEYEAVYDNDSKVILKVKAAAFDKNGYQYRCLMNQLEPEEDRITSNVYTLGVNRAAKLLSTQIASSLDTVVLSPITNEQTILTAPELAYGVPNPTYLWERKHLGVDLAFMPTGETTTMVTFSPTDTGTYEYRYTASNYCGGDTAKTSILVIKKISTSKMILITNTKEGVSDDTVVNKAQGSTFVFEECEGNTLRLISPKDDKEAVAKAMVWQYAAPETPTQWEDIVDGTPFHLNEDTLSIYPITVAYSGYQFRHVKTAPVERASDTSAVLSFVVSANESIDASLVDFVDMVLVDENLILKAHLGTEVESYKKGTYKYHWYEISKMGTASLLTTTDMPTYTITNLPLSKDSIRFFFEVENKCGAKAFSDTLRVRVLEKVELVWNTDHSSIVVEGETASIDICENTRSFLLVNAKKGVVASMIWQESNTGTAWTTIETSTNYEFSAQRDSLFIKANTSLNGRMYRAIAVGMRPELNDTTQQKLSLSVLLKPSLTAIVRTPDYDSLCIGQSISFTTTKSDADQVRWEIRAPGKMPQIVGEVNVLSLNIPVIHDSLHGASVYAVASNGCGISEVGTVLKLRKARSIQISLTGDTAICLGVPAQYNTSSTDVGSAPIYRWYVSKNSGDGLLSDYRSSALQNYIFPSAGNYKVIVELESDVYCVNESKVRDTVSVNVYERPQIRASIKDTLLVTGQSTVLTAKANGGTLPYVYTWSPADKLLNSQTDSTATIVFTSPERIDFIVRVLDANMCTAEDTASLRVNPNFTIEGVDGSGYFDGVEEGDKDTNMNFSLSADGLSLRVCEGQYIVLTPKSSGGTYPIAYTFDVEPVLPSDYSPGYTKDSVFTFLIEEDMNSIQIVMRDALGNEAQVVLALTVNEAPEVELDLLPEMENDRYYEMQPILYKADPANFESYAFFKLVGGSVVDKSTDTLQATYMTSFNKHERNEVRLWVKDANGCRGEASESIRVHPVPNTLVVGSTTFAEDAIIFPGCDIEVFNSWGQVIKKMGKDKKGWDGTSTHGKQLKNGTYYYNVKLPTKDGGTTLVKGAVTIIENKK